MITPKEINKSAAQFRVRDQPENKLTHDDFKKFLQEAFDWIKDEANITLQHSKDDIHESSNSSLFYVDYVGPLAGALGSRDIKIDITRGEKMEFAVAKPKVIITYSDLPQRSFTLQCYQLEEILIEKMAALMGRTEPRDLYDFWYLTEIERLPVKDYEMEFRNKANHKNQNPDEFADKVLRKEKIFERDWLQKLQNQIHDLPKFADVLRKVKRNLKG
ncbi:MAG TPA: nucleotidyl transferase AbiEii/AbiGii toxin family protein [Chitinophagaceae bacterium]|nr:nucleotidyl transferase AbiEii/AbiGii toxin family protein [Chitinophagaceae bacterium]